MTGSRSGDDDASFPDEIMAARKAAAVLSFGPLMFQAARVLRDSGALRILADRGDVGAGEGEIAEGTGLSPYAARVLLEAALAIGIVEPTGDDRHRITLLGRVIHRDRMTRVNMDFVHDVCWRPGFHLEAALREGRPAGLFELGDWPTIYEGLAELPEKVRASWLSFDHFYSDAAFDRALDEVLRHAPARVLDVGGNTGKFAMRLCAADPSVEVTIVDLPGQLKAAKAAIDEAGLCRRVTLHAADMLDPSAELPGDFAAIWMSQFLDCFGEDEIVSILRRARAALAPNGRIHVLEPLWDRQPNEVARYCVIATSLYFAAVANGTSKMLHSQRLQQLADAAGLKLEATLDGLGYGHTLMTLRGRSVTR